MDSREHRRVRLRLPVRLRWTTPFGQKIEIGETMDVSRSGLLVPAREPHAPGVPLWITFPYDSSLRDGQPEIFARVVRCDEIIEGIRAANRRKIVRSESALQQERCAKSDRLVPVLGDDDAPAFFAVAVQFKERTHALSNGNTPRNGPERRSSPRRALAVSIRVRPEQIPWFEEAMTIDLSQRGIRFRSCREYQPGDHLKIAFGEEASRLWAGTGEFRCQVVRVAPAPDGFGLEVIVARVE